MAQLHGETRARIVRAFFYIRCALAHGISAGGPMPTRKLTLEDIAIHFDKAIVDVSGAPARLSAPKHWVQRPGLLSDPNC